MSISPIIVFCLGFQTKCQYPPQYWCLCKVNIKTQKTRGALSSPNKTRRWVKQGLWVQRDYPPGICIVVWVWFLHFMRTSTSLSLSRELRSAPQPGSGRWNQKLCIFGLLSIIGEDHKVDYLDYYDSVSSYTFRIEHSVMLCVHYQWSAISIIFLLRCWKTRLFSAFS